ncbi:hypothetical protein E2C01_001021 [Portunus trituberculatus]|uniref:Uncharacterized protein n=1 Tax=Portunus trituberculatus TaxID=210409 RepID=A0A5B7CIA9_PORTR|nr:hypothetical protein [Portunus trituberculatus]
MVKNYLAQSAMNVDTSTADQVWLQFPCVPGVVFGCCYIPPSDSPYFSHSSFASIQDKILAIGRISWGSIPSWMGPIKWSRIDHDAIVNNISNIDLTNIDFTDVDNMLYGSSEASQVPVAIANVVSGGNRWDRLLNDPDDTRV